MEFLGTIIVVLGFPLFGALALVQHALYHRKKTAIFFCFLAVAMGVLGPYLMSPMFIAP